MEFIKDLIVNNLTESLVIAGFFISFFVPGLRNIWLIMFRVLTTKRALIQAVLYFGGKAVEHTETKLDDIWWTDVKKALIEELKK